MDLAFAWWPCGVYFSAVGGAVTVCFTYLRGIRSQGLHAFMIAAYTVVLASHPLRGPGPRLSLRRSRPR